AMRFNEGEVRRMGRVSTGVKGISLRPGDEVVDMAVLSEDSTLLTICENGYGKRTNQTEYPCKHRGGKGVIDIKTTERNGDVVACKEVQSEEEIMIMTQNGIMIRLPVEGLSTIGRNTQGVRVINLGKGDRVIDMTRLPKSEDEILEGEGEGEGEVDGAKVVENGETASEVASGDTDEDTPTEDTE
ncbi:DNA gyrase subunit A, partial [Candidatus Latescibacteria bacterium]|nr:DNA gyrase subunit A [Candidatus Latescibacterota bacterium]